MTFEITSRPPEDGAATDPISIDVLVPDKSKDDEIADVMLNNFEAVLGTDDYKLKKSWGKNVTIKARGKTPDFAIALTNNTVQGVSVAIDD